VGAETSGGISRLFAGCGAVLNLLVPGRLS
jgi:hypothetical protein